MSDDFYVGYQKKGPAALAAFTLTRVVLFLLVALAVGLAIAGFQKSIQPVTFEFGEVKEFKGVLSATPYPSLLVMRPGEVKDAAPFSRYLLVAPGKFGADELVDGFDGQEVSLKGSLVYNDGQTMIELLPGSIEASASGKVRKGSLVRSLGEHTLRGEIVDSKCYLGVMNPGNLKTHKSCAIRCISGGIPPVLLVRDAEGGPAMYFLLTDEEGGAVNDRVLDMIAEPLEITGMVERHDSQLVLKADPASYRREGGAPRPPL